MAIWSRAHALTKTRARTTKPSARWLLTGFEKSSSARAHFGRPPPLKSTGPHSFRPLWERCREGATRRGSLSPHATAECSSDHGRLICDLMPADIARRRSVRRAGVPPRAGRSPSPGTASRRRGRPRPPPSTRPSAGHRRHRTSDNPRPFSTSFLSRGPTRRRPAHIIWENVRPETVINHFNDEGVCKAPNLTSMCSSKKARDPPSSVGALMVHSDTSFCVCFALSRRIDLFWKNVDAFAYRDNRPRQALADSTRLDRPCAADQDLQELVRVVGIEPTLLSEPDFESGASTSSTTPALSRLAPMRLLAHLAPFWKPDLAAR